MMNLTLLAAVMMPGTLPQAETGPIPIQIQADQAVAEVNPAMYGVFFEEINQAGEGGIYAEMIRSRGMEDGAGTRLPTGWKATGTSAGTVVLDSTVTPDSARPHSLKITRNGSARVGVVNEGFWGLPLKAGSKYRLTLWVRGDVPVDVDLEDSSGKRLASTSVEATRGTWRRVETILTPTGSDSKSRLVISPRSAGTAWISFASLMPVDTYKGRKNGLRKDLAGHIASMNPGFVRFPGGCYIEGDTLAGAFDWKQTIGPIEKRKPMARTFWGYPASNGLGYHEYLQWCEDMNARALFVANCGMSHREVAPMDKMGRYVQDALDAIEYAVGPVTSKWGAIRAQNGHPKPFNLRYIQIGNENGGPAYDERYALMAKAIKAKYPNIELVANVWGGVPQSYPLEIIDEHYYNNPDFFWRNSNRYDSYDRKGPKIYVGEYAVTKGSGTGNLAAALSEAAFMAGMEKNADIVRMSSYAPLFVNVNNRQWNPNAVVFNSDRSYGTPSYWVQWMFANHRPDRIVRHQASIPAMTEPKPLTGQIGLMTWRTQAEFKDIELEADGKPLLKASELSQEKLQVLRGDWKFENGVVRQTARQEDRRAMIRGVEIPVAKKVTMRLKARKLSGDEGFIILMGVSPGKAFQWNLGGWENTVHAFQVDDERTGRGVPGAIETNRWYDIRIEREGAETRAYLDNKLVESIKDQPTPDFATVVGVDDKKNELIVKAVNGSASARKISLDIVGATVGRSARAWVLRGSDPQAENSFETPEVIRPRELRVPNVGSKMTMDLAPYSFTIVRIPRR